MNLWVPSSWRKPFYVSMDRSPCCNAQSTSHLSALVFFQETKNYSESNIERIHLINHLYAVLQ